MSLSKQWHDLDRSTVRTVPDRYALYEVGDADGTTLGFGIGVLPDALRELLAYETVDTLQATPEADAAGDPAQVRWELANSKAHAERLREEHVGD